MTDFIHEQPKAPQEQKAPAYVPPKTEAERQKKVYKYVGILFLVAAILIAWSFLMTHRSNQQVLSELKESTSTLQSAFDKNEELTARVEELEEQLHALEVENVTLKNEAARLEHELAAAQQALSPEQSPAP